MLREVKPRNARTARIVKAREPQLVESRKRVLLLHGSRCPQPVNSVLKTFHNLTKPNSILFNKKNENVHPFEDPASLEFLAMKNDCGVVVFGTHSKKRPNNITVLRVFDSRLLDMVELLLLNATEQTPREQNLQVGIGMKPLILFAGSQWDDTSSSAQASLYQSLKSLLLDLFQGEEISSIDVEGLQYILMIAADEIPSQSTNSDDPSMKPTIHLRWYRVRTLRSNTPKLPRVELDQIGPSFDFRVGRHREADTSLMREAMRHGKRPNEAKSQKNIETDLVGDKIGRVHLGRQSLDLLQTRKMKGLKRSRDDLEDRDMGNAQDIDEADAVGEIDQDEDEDGGMDLDDLDAVVNGHEDMGESENGFNDGEEEALLEDNELPKRQKLVP